MNNRWSRILFQLFAFSMWGLAVVGTLLFFAASLGLAGYLPSSLSLNMMGRAAESKDDYQASMAVTVALGFIGWLYVWLRVSGRLRFVTQQEHEETETLRFRREVQSTIRQKLPPR